MKKRLPPKLKKFPAAKQRRLDALLDNNSEGTITASERFALESLVTEAERLMKSNAKRLAEFSASETASPPGGAVPVTVWVKPETVR